MLCRKCGAQIDDNATECKFCGEKFETAQSKENPAAEAEAVTKGEEKPVVEAQRSTHEIFEENEKKRRAQTEKVVDEKKQQLNEINERREQKKRREKRNKIIVIALICVAVAAAAAIGAYYFKTKDANPDIVTSTAAPTASARPTLTPITTDEPEVSATPEATAEPSQATTQTNTASGNSHSYSGDQTSTGANASASSSNTGASSTAGSGNAAPSRATSAPAASSANTASSSTTGGSRLGTRGTSYNVPAKLNGNSSNKLTAELAIGGHVVYDQSAKKTIMSFAVGNTTYYAYVADGSYTSGVNGKYMTVTAVPTSGKYNGNTVYEITKLTYYDLGDYVIPDSGIRLLAEQELNKYTKAQLGIARNEIYARHGRDFKTKEYKDYFSAKSWYKVDSRYNYENESANLNKIEQKNIDMILKVEASK